MEIDDNYLCLEQNIQAAYRQQQIVQPDASWQERLMDAIAQTTVTADNDAVAVERFVWRLATAASILLVGLAAVYLYNGLLPEPELTQALIADPLGLLWASCWGV